MRPPEFKLHAEHIKDYIKNLGLLGVTQEIRFALNDLLQDDPLLLDEVLEVLHQFQDQLKDIQNHRIETIVGAVHPIGVKKD